MMKKISLGAVAAFILAISHLSHAQQPTKIPRIGYPNWLLPFQLLACRDIPAGSARAWVRGGEKHHH